MNLQIVRDILNGADKVSLAMQEISTVKEGYKAMENLLCPPGSNSNPAEVRWSEARYGSIRSLLQPFEEGNAMDERFVRAAMLARFSTFLWGKSGVHFNVVLQLMHFLNKGITPYLPMRMREAAPLTEGNESSLVSSSAPSFSSSAADAMVQVTEHAVWGAHLTDALTGNGMVFYKGRWCTAAEAMKAEGIFPLQLRLRDGDALLAGFPVVKGAAMHFADELTRMLPVVTVLSFWANELAGTDAGFVALRAEGSPINHWGEQQVSACMRHLAESSRCLTQTGAQDGLPSGFIPAGTAASERFRQMETAATHLIRRLPDALWRTPQYVGVWYDTWEAALNTITVAYNAVDDTCALDEAGKRIGTWSDESDELLLTETGKLALLATRIGRLSGARIAALANDCEGMETYAAQTEFPVAIPPVEGTVADFLRSVSGQIDAAWDALAAEALHLTLLTKQRAKSGKLAALTSELYDELVRLLGPEGSDRIQEGQARIQESPARIQDGSARIPGVSASDGVTAEIIRSIRRHLAEKEWELIA